MGGPEPCVRLPPLLLPTRCSPPQNTLTLPSGLLSVWPCPCSWSSAPTPPTPAGWRRWPCGRTCAPTARTSSTTRPSGSGMRRCARWWSIGECVTSASRLGGPFLPARPHGHWTPPAVHWTHPVPPHAPPTTRRTIAYCWSLEASLKPGRNLSAALLPLLGADGVDRLTASYRWPHFCLQVLV